MARPGAACQPPARRVMVAARALLFWALVYSYCGVCACIAGLRLLWSIGRRPGETFRWVMRENPPACLNDPSLGTHCYVRIKVKAGVGGSGPRRAHPCSRARVSAACAPARRCMPVRGHPCMLPSAGSPAGSPRRTQPEPVPCPGVAAGGARAGQRCPWGAAPRPRGGAAGGERSAALSPVPEAARLEPALGPCLRSAPPATARQEVVLARFLPQL